LHNIHKAVTCWSHWGRFGGVRGEEDTPGWRKIYANDDVEGRCGREIRHPRGRRAREKEAHRLLPRPAAGEGRDCGLGNLKAGANKGGVVRIFAFTLWLAFFMSVPHLSPVSRAEEPLRALLVMAFAPGDSLRQAAEGDLLETISTLEEFGFQVAVLDAYNPDGSVSSCPHYRLHRHLEEYTYRLLVYYGHGDSSRWAFHLPQDPAWAGRTDTEEGYYETVAFGDSRQHWQQDINLAPRAMVILRHACYSNGLRAEDTQEGASLLSEAEVLGRINEYSYTFLYPQTGIISYTASASRNYTPSYLRTLFREHGRPVGEVTVPDLGSQYSADTGYRLLRGEHFYLGSSGYAYRKNRMPGSANSQVWGQAAWAGNPKATASWIFGRVPGDENGDGDNTDLGEPCFPHDSRDLFLTEDTTYNFFPFLCLANPGKEGTWARITFLDEEDEYLTVYREVPGRSRITLDCNANRYLRNKDLSVRVESVDGTPLLAERPMYFRYAGWMDGGSDSFGAPQPSASWYFAEGYASDRLPFHEYLCVGNFNPREVMVKLSLLGNGGQALVREFALPALTRRTFLINSYVQGEVSVVLEGDGPVVAERSMYYRYAAVAGSFVADGGHTKAGSTSLSDTWYFAEGHVSPDFEEWICLANPGVERVSADVYLYTSAGKKGPWRVEIPARGRSTVMVNRCLGAAVSTDVSAVVKAERPIVCERAMYFRFNGTWDDGHVSPGSPVLSNTWNFAEGSAYPGIQEYILVMNPGKEETLLEFTFLLGPGEGTRKALYRLGGEGRLSLNLNAELSSLGSPPQVAAIISSERPVAVERAMYFDMGRGGEGREPIRGGHVSPGASAGSPQWYFAETYTGR